HISSTVGNDLDKFGQIRPGGGTANGVERSCPAHAPRLPVGGFLSIYPDCGAAARPLSADGPSRPDRLGRAAFLRLYPPPPSRSEAALEAIPASRHRQQRHSLHPDRRVRTVHPLVP